MFYVLAICAVAILFDDIDETNGSFTDNRNSAKRAFIKCREISNAAYYMKHIDDCNLASELSAVYKAAECRQACLGLNSCIKICPRQALTSDHNVLYEKCDGCGLCADICPRKLIEIRESSQVIYISCVNSDASKICTSGCTRCNICIENCAESAIRKNKEGLPEIIQEKCSFCNKCVYSCPMGIIKISYF